MNTRQLTVREVKAQLSEAGIQTTSQRLHIARFVLNDRTHPTVKEVMDGVRKNLEVVNQATVYNTLNILVERGLVREVLLSGLAEVECNKAEPGHAAQDDVGPHQDEKTNDDDDRFQSSPALLCVFP